MSTTSLTDWHDQGERVPLSIAGNEVSVFRRIGGAGDDMWTMLHGWPTSSWDWAPVAPAIEADHRTLSFDFPGLGASDKGDDVRYDIDALTDTVIALWEHDAVTSTRIVAHDVGTIVAQELLARDLAGDLDVTIESVTWLNGSIYPDLYRPTDTQLALVDPETGPTIQAVIDENSYSAGIASVHHADHRPDAETLRQHWAAFEPNNGVGQMHRFLQYIPERARRADRLVHAIENTTVPQRFVWGLADEISGAAQATRIRERFGADVDLVAFDDCSHYPHTERPSDVAEQLLRPW